MPHGLDFQQSDERVAIEAGGLRLTFRQRDGRWSHALVVGDGRSYVLQAAAASVEGDFTETNATRVMSPVYQEIHRHPDGRMVCLLLTGQAAAHHFSAVVSVRAAEESIIVVVDVADRCRAPVEALAATYSVAFGSSDLLAADPNRVVWGGDALGHGQLELVADADGQLALAEAGRRGSRVQSLAKIDPAAGTHRLAYRWVWTPATQKNGACVQRTEIPASEPPEGLPQWTSSATWIRKSTQQ